MMLDYCKRFKDFYHIKKSMKAIIFFDMINDKEVKTVMIDKLKKII